MKNWFKLKKNRFKKWFKFHVIYFLEAVILYTFFYCFKMLSVDRASALGGRIGVLVGPWLRLSSIADDNLKKIFPELSFSERRDIIVGMWEHLGRLTGEFPHLERILAEGEERITMVNEHILHDLKNIDRSKIFVSGHVGNWELLIGVGERSEISFKWLYRHMRNPYAERLLQRTRGGLTDRLFIKGHESLLAILTALKDGDSIGFLSDHRYRHDLWVDFCGCKGWTTSLPALLGLRFGCPVVPVRVERLEGVHFRVTVYPPLEIRSTGRQAEDIREGTLTLNRVLEGWIRERPEQWTWIHKRWDYY